ncbi:Pyridoxamine 5'-phosphate oxidase [Lachnospiraceae bacterium]|nr:Pyridoxamine 5'-phosphate oxidase [Lachnospiraceae bacterium]
MWEIDYDEAASIWIDKEKKSVHMEKDALKEKIDEYIKLHNTGALAVSVGDFVRCTPIEYNYVDNCVYLFSEGGLKFRALKHNKHVAFAIYEPYGGFQHLKSLQIMGTASMVEPFTDEYLKIMKVKKIPVETMKKLSQPMNLIKIVPENYDYLDSDLKSEGFGSRQHLGVESEE